MNMLAGSAGAAPPLRRHENVSMLPWPQKRRRLSEHLRSFLEPPRLRTASVFMVKRGNDAHRDYTHDALFSARRIYAPTARC